MRRYEEAWTRLKEIPHTEDVIQELKDDVLISQSECLAWMGEVEKAMSLVEGIVNASQQRTSISDKLLYLKALLTVEQESDPIQVFRQQFIVLYASLRQLSRIAEKAFQKSKDSMGVIVHDEKFYEKSELTIVLQLSEFLMETVMGWYPKSPWEPISQMLERIMRSKLLPAKKNLCFSTLELFLESFAGHYELGSVLAMAHYLAGDHKTALNDVLNLEWHDSQEPFAFLLKAKIYLELFTEQNLEPWKRVSLQFAKESLEKMCKLDFEARKGRCFQLVQAETYIAEKEISKAIEVCSLNNSKDWLSKGSRSFDKLHCYRSLQRRLHAVGMLFKLKNICFSLDRALA